MGIVYFILVFTVIVFVHEMGHFLFAKKFGVHCSEFAIGFGPKLVSFEKNNTLFSIRAIPLGGFVNIAHEEFSEDYELAPGEKFFEQISAWRRVIVLGAGVVFNLIFALVVITISFSIMGTLTNEIEVIDKESILENVNTGDKIVAVNDIEIVEIEQTSKILSEQKATGSLTLVFDSGYEQTIANTTADTKLGIKLKTKTDVLSSFVNGVTTTFMILYQTIVGIIPAILGIFIGNTSGATGPIGLYSYVNAAASSGLINLLFLTGLLSISIAVFNLLPLPALDGGKILIIALEKLFKKEFDKKVIYKITAVSFGILLLLMIIVSISDILRLVNL